MSRLGHKRFPRWLMYNAPSVFAQKMGRLSCKIFGEYYSPPMPYDLGISENFTAKVGFLRVHKQNEALVVRQSEIPKDLMPAKNYNYYPPHPQIRELIWTLREHGLYRDEHLDFVEEMKRLRILRGKRYRVKGGMSGKRAQLRAGEVLGKALQPGTL